MSKQHRLSGRQVTVIVVAVCAAVVLAPVGVFAASHSTFSLADGKHPSRLATVTKTGAQVVTVSGTPKVHLSGTSTVTAVPGVPGKPFAASATTASDTVSVDVPSGSHAVVQTVSVKITVDNSVTVAGAELTYTQGGVLERMDFPTTMIEKGTGSDDNIFGTTIPVAIYPDPGSSVSVLPQYDSADLADTQLTVSGYTTS